MFHKSKKKSTSFLSDVNECEQNVCPVNSICINTIPSYRCECHEGWEGQQCDIG